jgi:Kef-type K+ transport system membrane component KefB
METDAKFWLTLVGIAIGGVIAALGVYWLFGYLWYTMGFLGAFVVLGAVALAFGWLTDRRAKKRRAGLADI